MYSVCVCQLNFVEYHSVLQNKPGHEVDIYQTLF